MAVTSGFFNSLYGDRKYTAEQFSALFNGLINDGVFSNIGTAFRVSATTDNNITIGIGRAWFNGIWVNNDALLPMTCNDPEVLLDRIDAVVIEINRSEAVRAGRIIFVKGTASGTPVNPTLTHNESVDQYPLAYIRRKAGVSAVVQADITNCIGTSACPYVTGILETQNIDNVVAQWESQFNIWFNDLQVELEGDVAANLASQVIDLNMRFNELAETRTVTVELQDSSLDTIEDSSESAILGSTVLGESNAADTPATSADAGVEYKVGDILTTSRTGLGLNWILCNGSKVSRSEYPDLSALLPASFSGPWKEPFILKDASGSVSKMIYANGYYICGGSYTEESGSGKEIAFIAYTSDLSGSWTFKTVFTSTQYVASISDIMYHDGYYVVAGIYRNSNQMYARIAYTTDIINGEWSSKNIWSSSGSSGDLGLVRLRYLNGYYVACGWYSEEVPCFAYASSIPSTWTLKTLYASSSVTRRVLDMIYADGLYSAIVYSDSGIECLQKSSLSDNTWGDAGFTDLVNAGDASIYDWYTGANGTKVEYVNGSYVLTYTGSHGVGLSYSDDLTDVYPTGLVNMPASGGNSVSDFIVHDGKYILLIKSISESNYDCRLYLAATESLEKPNWLTVDLGVNVYDDDWCTIQYVNGNYAICCATYTDETPTPTLILTDPDMIQIPEIALSDSAYSYIKARGD